MEFKLLDNGIDSLKLGIEFYEEYLAILFKKKEESKLKKQEPKFKKEESKLKKQELKFKKDSYLKLAIICIHNSVEILSKQIISQLNQLLIYKDIDNVLSNFVKLQETEEYKNLHDFLIMNNVENIETISYSLCIDRLYKLYNNRLTDANIKDFKDIGYERNKLTHFGVSKQLDYHKLIGLINRIIECIKEFFLEELKKIEDDKLLEELKKIEDDKLVNRLNSVVQSGKLIEKSEWIKSTSTQIDKLYEILDAVIKNDENLVIYNGEEDAQFYIESKCNELSLETIILPHLDSMFLIMEQEYSERCTISAIIDFSEGKYIYVPDSDEFDFNNDLKVKSWIKNRKYRKMNLNESSIRTVFDNIFDLN